MVRDPITGRGAEKRFFWQPRYERGGDGAIYVLHPDGRRGPLREDSVQLLNRLQFEVEHLRQAEGDEHSLRGVVAAGHQAVALSRSGASMSDGQDPLTWWQELVAAHWKKLEDRLTRARRGEW